MHCKATPQWQGPGCHPGGKKLAVSTQQPVLSSTIGPPPTNYSTQFNPMKCTTFENKHTLTGCPPTVGPNMWLEAARPRCLRRRWYPQCCRCMAPSSTLQTRILLLSCPVCSGGSSKTISGNIGPASSAIGSAVKGASEAGWYHQVEGLHSPRIQSSYRILLNGE